MTFPEWPAHEHFDNYHFGAALCRRGHVITTVIDPTNIPRSGQVAPPKCSTCGGRVIVACPHCNLRIRGGTPGVIGFGYQPPNFCERCGSALPWASRESRIMELENVLDEGGVDDADLSVIADQLRRLREESAISPKDERALWSTVKARAGAVFMNEKVQALLLGIASAEARQHLGLPPA